MNKKIFLILPTIVLLASCVGKNNENNNEDPIDPEQGTEITDEAERQQAFVAFDIALADLADKDLLEFDGDFTFKTSYGLKTQAGQDTSQKVNVDLSFHYDIVADVTNTLVDLKEDASFTIPSVGLKISDFNLTLEVVAQMGDFKVSEKTKISDLTFGAYLNGDKGLLYIDLSDESINANLDNFVKLLKFILPESGDLFPAEGSTIEDIFGTDQILVDLNLASEESDLPKYGAIVANKIPIIFGSTNSDEPAEELFSFLGAKILKYSDDKYGASYKGSKDDINSLIEKCNGESLPDNIDFNIESDITIVKEGNLFRLDEFNELIEGKVEIKGMNVEFKEASNLAIKFPKRVIFFGDFVSGSASDYSAPTFNE